MISKTYVIAISIFCLFGNSRAQGFSPCGKITSFSIFDSLESPEFPLQLEIYFQCMNEYLKLNDRVVRFVDEDGLEWSTFYCGGNPSDYSEYEANAIVDDHGITLYPNPTHSSFSISGLSDPSSITIFDLSGKAILKTSISSQESISTEDLETGIYLVEIISGMRRQTLKLVKE